MVAKLQKDGMAFPVASLAFSLILREVKPIGKFSYSRDLVAFYDMLHRMEAHCTPAATQLKAPIPGTTTCTYDRCPAPRISAGQPPACYKNPYLMDRVTQSENAYINSHGK